MVCNRCGAGIPPGYGWCVHCGAWAGTSQTGWPYVPPGYGPQQPVGGPQYNMPGYYYQQQPATAPVQWPQDYGYNPSQGRETGQRGAAVRGGAPLVYSLVTLACGLAVILSTFLPWAGMLGYNVSGWSMLSAGGWSNGGNFLFAYGKGMLVFTGFWSLLVGVAIVAGIAILLSGRRFGARIAQVAGGMGLVLSLITIVMLYTHKVGAGIGLWMFVVLSAASVVFAQLAVRAAFRLESRTQ